MWDHCSVLMCSGYHIWHRCAETSPWLHQASKAAVRLCLYFILSKWTLLSQPREQGKPTDVFLKRTSPEFPFQGRHCYTRALMILLLVIIQKQLLPVHLFLLSLREDKQEYKPCHAGTPQHHLEKHTGLISISAVLVLFSSFHQIAEVQIHNTTNSKDIWQNAAAAYSKCFEHSKST